ncbi:hypothetical protein C2G38_2177811 [Gigaspora rosea]|uniref:Uncharacterized protein n=1 Tax=Gigaspora rosea TaxID=44941 RepID=A0A397VM92_9GLOM|nr:hypothetical protein C2G38_2177811 [Gigaspora rosea]
MGYNIRSHDDSINEVILSVLKELDDTFFADYSGSKGEVSNSVLDDESISDDDFPDIPLNKLNEFNFVDVPDNYIEDKIYDDLKLKVKKFFDKAEFESLEKNMRDMVIKGQLLAFQRNENTDKVTNDDRKNLRFSYCYNHDIPVCLDTYLNLVGVGRTYLKNIKQHLQEHCLEERMAILACKDKYGKDARILAKSTFTNIWKSLMPSLQFMSLKTDLCESQKERDYYNANIISAVEDSKHNPNVVGSQILFKSFSGESTVHLFGVCNTGNFPHTQQTNYAIDEAEMPDDGEQDDLQDNYESFTIRPFSFNADTPLPTIDVKPLSQKR